MISWLSLDIEDNKTQMAEKAIIAALMMLDHGSNLNARR
jgi:hypothetical protein